MRVSYQPVSHVTYFEICIASYQEVTLKDNEITALRKQTEREFLEKIKIEDNIMEKMRSQLTLDKAAQYTKKMTDRLRKRATELVCVNKRLNLVCFVNELFLFFWAIKVMHFDLMKSNMAALNNERVVQIEFIFLLY